MDSRLNIDPSANSVRPQEHQAPGESDLTRKPWSVLPGEIKDLILRHAGDAPKLSRLRLINRDACDIIDQHRPELVGALARYAFRCVLDDEKLTPYHERHIVRSKTLDMSYAMPKDAPRWLGAMDTVVSRFPNIEHIKLGSAYAHDFPTHPRAPNYLAQVQSSLAIMGKLTHLRGLDLRHVGATSDYLLAPVLDLPNLAEHLTSLSFVTDTPNFFASALARLIHLQTLTIRGTGRLESEIDPSEKPGVAPLLNALCNLPALASLTVNDQYLEPGDCTLLVASVGFWPKLAILSLAGASGTHADAAQEASDTHTGIMPQPLPQNGLISLDMTSIWQPAWRIAPLLASATNLSAVNLSLSHHVSARASVLRALAEAQALESLILDVEDFDMPTMTEVGNVVANKQRLETFELHITSFSSEEDDMMDLSPMWHKLAALPKLTSLGLFSNSDEQGCIDWDPDLLLNVPPFAALTGFSADNIWPVDAPNWPRDSVMPFLAKMPLLENVELDSLGIGLLSVDTVLTHVNQLRYNPMDYFQRSPATDRFPRLFPNLKIFRSESYDVGRRDYPMRFDTQVFVPQLINFPGIEVLDIVTRLPPRNYHWINLYPDLKNLVMTIALDAPDYAIFGGCEVDADWSRAGTFAMWLNCSPKLESITLLHDPTMRPQLRESIDAAVDWVLATRPNIKRPGPLNF